MNYRKDIKNFVSYLFEADEKDKKVKQPESVLIYSDRFRKVLNDIMNMKTSNISKRLLDLESDKTKLFDFSYIDINPADPEIVTYLQTNRINRFKQENKSEEEYWTSKSRTPQKIGRFIKQLLPSFSDKAVSKFTDKYKVILKEEEESKNFELVDGDDIIFWYNYKNYETENGSLGGSCMSGPEAGRYMNIYRNNPDQCKLLILKNADGTKIKGRALVWKLSTPKDKIFMDRVYSNKQNDEILFTNYAKKEGWLCKDEQKYGETNIIVPGEGSKNLLLEVILDNTDFDLYPYLDTMRYFYPDHKLLRNMTSNKGELGQLYTLTDTEGHYQEYDWDEDMEDPMVYDAYNNEEIPESQAYWCEVDNGYCNRNDVVRLAYNGTWAFPNSKNVVYSEYSKKYYAKKDCVFSNPLNTWIWKNYAVDVYSDKNRTTPPEKTHRFELNKTIGKIGEYYYDIDLVKPVSSKQIPIKDKPGKFKTEYTYEFK